MLLLGIWGISGALGALGEEEDEEEWDNACICTYPSIVTTISFEVPLTDFEGSVHCVKPIELVSWDMIELKGFSAVQTSAHLDAVVAAPSRSARCYLRRPRIHTSGDAGRHIEP